MFDDLVAAGWVKKTRTPDGLNIYKYAKKTFFKNLWHHDSRLLDARGIVLDDDGNIVQLPFQKIFGFGENNTLVDRDRKVVAVRKINGFLGVATFYKSGLLVSTTGSTTSAYVALARKHLDKPAIRELLERNPAKSFMFEIVDESDLHIVPEELGAYLIGCRDKVLGSPPYDEAVLDAIVESNDALAAEVKRPYVLVDIFDNIRQRLKTEKIEGYIIRDFFDESLVLCKLKGPHYLSKKAIMRMGAGKVDRTWDQPAEFVARLDEDFVDVFRHIRASYSADAWKLLRDTDRRVVIEDFLPRGQLELR